MPTLLITDYLAYDHSRVPITLQQDAPDATHPSSYINANYIPGHNQPKCYIATQGPTAATIADFWAMVWEQSSECIVMLTTEMEAGKRKCERYIPDSALGERRVDHGPVAVEVKSSIEFAGFQLTNLLVQHQGVTRSVTHFQYTLWLDRATPDPAHLLALRSEIRERFPIATTTTPIVVHCSAGVGRTGVFIVLDTVLAAIEAGEFNGDVYSIVYTARKHRIHMVQTWQQVCCDEKRSRAHFRTDML